MRTTALRAAWMCAALVSCATENYQLTVIPSLRPVDAARPMLVFSQIAGKACGRDAVLGALRDMDRLDGIDGYLEVVIEAAGEGDQRCARASSYPFRYGTDPSGWTLRGGEPRAEPRLVPGRDSAPQPSATATGCASECERIARLVESGAIAQGLARERCVARCNTAGREFADCIAAARDQSSAMQCTSEGSAR